MVHNSFLDAEDGAQTSIEALRDRYGFLVRAIAKVPDLNHPEIVDATLREYQDMRERSASATYGPEDIPGWRVMVLHRRDNHVLYSGVRADGAILQGLVESENGLEKSTAREVGLDVAQAMAPAAKPPYAQVASKSGSFSEAFKQGYTEDTRTGQGTRFVYARDERSVGDKTFVDGTWLGLSAYSATTQDRAQSAASADTQLLMDFILSKHEEREKDLGPDRTGPQTGSISERDYDRLHGALYTALKRSSARRYGAMAASCRRAVDPEAAKIMSSIGDHSPNVANWLSGAYVDSQGQTQVEPLLARNRRQAISSYPILGRFFTTDYQNRDFGYAIDLGEELTRPLAEDLETSPAVLKRLNGLTWQKAGRRAFKGTDEFIESLNITDLSHFPQDRKGFADWGAVTQAAINICWATGSDPKKLLQPIGNRFASVARELEQNPAEGVNDLRADIERRLLRPAVAQRLVAEGIDSNEAMRQARSYGRDDPIGPTEAGDHFAGHSLRSALKASARWHRALGRINETLGDGSKYADPNASSWTPLVGEIDAGEGLRLVELSTLAALRTEGLQQNHCVGGYGPEVKSGRALIFSLRRGDEIISTIEASRDMDEHGRYVYSVNQNMGKSNREMARENNPRGRLAKGAERTLLASLRGLDPACEQRYQASLDKTAHLSGGASMNELAGYDIFDRKGLELAFDTLKEYLPKDQSKMTLDRWVDHVMPEREEKVAARQKVSHAEQGAD